MRKRTKKRGGLRFPPHHPKRPLAKRGKGSTRTTKKRVFLKLGAKLFLFILVLVKHKHKTMSSASEFENDVLKHLTSFCCLCNLANKKSQGKECLNSWIL